MTEVPTSTPNQEKPMILKISDEKLWSEVEKYKADSECEKAKVYAEAFHGTVNTIANTIKEYQLRTRTRLTLITLGFVSAIFGVMAYLTIIGKISGETLAFVGGTITGYIISLLKP